MSRRIPAYLVSTYNDAIKRQGDAAERSAKQVMRAYLNENPDASIEDIRNFAIEVMKSAGELHGNACSQAAFDLQDEIARLYGGRPPDVSGWYYEPDAESIERTARYQVGKIEDGDIDGFISQIGDAARYYAERGANSTMAETARQQAKRDGKSSGKRKRRSGAHTYGVAFARVPMGPTTCPFCLMLASRGFVYLSEESAGEFDRYHRHCDCRIVPSYKGASLEGYDPDEYYDRWKNPEKYETAGGLGSGSSRSVAPGIPKYERTIDFSKATIQEAVEVYEAEIVDKTVEHAIIIKPNGEVWRSVGDEISVNIESEDLDLTGCIVTHNHPLEPNRSSCAPSESDFLEIQRHPEIAEFRAVYGRYNYSVRATDTVSQTSWSDARDKVMIFDVDDDIHHAVMEVLNRDGFVEYSREESSRNR